MPSDELIDDASQLADPDVNGGIRQAAPAPFVGVALIVRAHDIVLQPLSIIGQVAGGRELAARQQSVIIAGRAGGLRVGPASFHERQDPLDRPQSKPAISVRQQGGQRPLRSCFIKAVSCPERGDDRCFIERALQQRDDVDLTIQGPVMPCRAKMPPGGQDRAGRVALEVITPVAFKVEPRVRRQSEKAADLIEAELVGL